MTDATPDLQALTEHQIAALTDSGSFSRGKTYFRKGHIISPSLEGQLLRAYCQGSDTDYQVTATIAPTGTRTASNPTSWSCTCPRGGFCKHVVALLLTWVHDRNAFQVRRPLGDVLAALDRDALVSVITGLVAHTPDLREALEVLIQTTDPRVTSKPGISATQASSRARRAYRQFVEAQFQRGGGQREVMTDGLGSMLEMAEQAARLGAWRQAIPLASGLVEEAGDVFEQYDDEGGTVRDTVNRAERILIDALAAQETLPAAHRLNEEDHERIITTLFGLWYTDVIKIGGIDLSLGGREAILTYGTAAEQAEVLAQLRDLPQTGEWAASETDRFTARLLAAGEVDQDRLLAKYLDRALWVEASALLVTLNRPAEAIKLARQHLREPRSLLPVATALATQGDDQRTKAIQLVEDTLWETEGKLPGLDQMFRDWLIEQYLLAGAGAEALALATTSFERHPNREGWDRLHVITQHDSLPPTTWAQVRQTALNHLQQTGNWHQVAGLLLDEGDLPGALAAYRHIPSGYGYDVFGFNQSDLGWRLAQAAESVAPDDAIAIYRKRAETLIARRKRDSYRDAATYLERIRDTLRHHDRETEWVELISGIRTEFKTLRALREELDRKGL